MSLVTLHVYDITNTQYEAANTAIQNLNRFTKDALGAGGIFHGAVEVNGDEWSYGYCDRGSGVYPCRPKGNTGYTYRESVALGVTALAPASVQRILHALRLSWPGHEYDLLARNCNHFCAALCEKLGVMPPPQWVNRFAGHADATVAAVTYARDQTRMVVEEIGLAATAATNWPIRVRRDGTARRRANTRCRREGAANGGEGAANGGAANGGAADGRRRTEAGDEETRGRGREKTRRGRNDVERADTPRRRRRDDVTPSRRARAATREHVGHTFKLTLIRWRFGGARRARASA